MQKGIILSAKIKTLEIIRVVSIGSVISHLENANKLTAYSGSLYSRTLAMSLCGS